MIRKFKALGLALVAVLALGAMAASAASAEGKYVADEYPATGTATSSIGNDIFTTEAGTVECSSTFHSTLSEPSSHLTVIPHYTNCKAFGFATAHVTMNSCDYTFETPDNIGTHVWTIPVKVTCTDTSKPITITAGNCEATVNTQTPGGHVIATVDTNAGDDDVTVRATVTGINYTVTKDGFLCPFSGTGPKTGATYVQEEEITFHAPERSIGIQ